MYVIEKNMLSVSLREGLEYSTFWCCNDECNLDYRILYNGTILILYLFYVYYVYYISFNVIKKIFYYRIPYGV